MKHEPELIPAPFDSGYAIGVKCLADGCGYFIISSKLPNETMLNDFEYEHADRMGVLQ